MSRPEKSLFCILTAVGFLLGNATAIQAQPGRVHDPNKAEVLTLPLTPRGFAAPYVNLSAGLYVIYVPNGSGIRNLRIEIDKMPGNSLSDVPSEHTDNEPEDQHDLHFSSHVRLTPGTYRVRITGQPAWICAIHVK